MPFSAASFEDDLEERSTGSALGWWKCAPGDRESGSHNHVLRLRPRNRNIPGATST